MNILADEFQIGIAHQHTWQQADFGQDLKAVADADHRRALVGTRFDFAHDRRFRGHGTATQVITVGKAARHGDQINAGQFRVAMPVHDNLTTGDVGQRNLDITITVGTGKDDDSGFHWFSPLAISTE